MGIEGHTAIVTGASRGIGLAVARVLAAEGANVALWSRDAGEARAAAESIGMPDRVEGRAVDVRDEGQVAAAVKALEADAGPVRVLVNNAGTPGPAGREWEADAGSWWECIESSVRGAYLCSKAVLPGMLERGTGRIVHMASVAGGSPFPMTSATSVAKTALIRHAENLALAVAGKGVSAFALHPGLVDTELLSSYRSDPRFAAFLDGMPPQAYSPPEVVASLVARIAHGDFDALSGCFLDATTNLDTLLAGDEEAGRGPVLRIVG